MRVAITGATGFVGNALCSELHKSYEVIALSRDAGKARQSLGNMATVVRWDAKTPNGWEQAIDGASAIVNLAGENVGTGRWNRSKKNRILQSRLDAAKAIVEAIKLSQQKPQVVIQASAVGYYGNRSDEVLDESSPRGTGFLADVCRQWERAIQPLDDSGVRLVTVRLGPVLGAEGGIMPKILPAFRFFLGGHPGSGKQWLSWIHIDDVTGAIRFLIEDNNSHGVFNLTAPNPVLGRDFYKLVGKAMHRPAGFPLPGVMLKMLMGQMATELLLSSQKVIPQKLLHTGYKFRYAEADRAIESVVEESR